MSYCASWAWSASMARSSARKAPGNCPRTCGRPWRPLPTPGGGTILLGVAERGGQFEIAGLVDAAKVQHDLVNGLRQMLNVPIAAQVDPLVVNVSGQERVLFSVYVPEAVPYQKPVYIRNLGLDKGCYRRVGLNRADTLIASRSLTRLEGLGLLRRSEQRRGPGVFYTLIDAQSAATAQTTHQITAQVTAQGVSQLLTAVSTGERLTQGQMDDLLVALCAERPLRTRELGEMLHRSARHLRDGYLSRLVDEGRLELTGSPNDPNVAYRARAGGQ